MLVPAGAETFSRGNAHRRRDLPRAEGRARRARPRDRRSATRAASRPTSARATMRARRSSRRPSAPATASGWRSRSTRRRASSTGTAHTASSGRAARSTRRDDRLLGRPGRPVPDRVDRGRAGRGRLGRLADAHRRARRPGPARRRRPLRHERRAASAAGSTSGVANAILVKVNQIGTLTETLDAIELAPAQRLRRGHLAPLRRDRGRDDRRPRRRDERRPDQDRRAVAHRPRREVQPAPADRGGARRRAPCTRAGRAFPRAGASLRQLALTRSAPHEDRRDDRPASATPRDARARSIERGWTAPPQLLARLARATTRARRNASAPCRRRPAGRSR